MLPKTLIYLPVYVACREQEAAAYSSAEGNLPQMSLDQGTLVSSTRLSTQGAMASEHDAQTTLEIVKVTVSDLYTEVASLRGSKKVVVLLSMTSRHKLPT